MLAEQIVYHPGALIQGGHQAHTPVLPHPDNVWSIRQRYRLDDETAELVAHIVAQEFELAAQEDAQLIFSADDGSGPYCSACGVIGMLCGHGRNRTENDD